MPHAGFEREFQEPVRAGERCELGALPDDRGRTRQLQDVAPVEVEDEEAGARVGGDVAEGVEEEIAAKVGHDEHARSAGPARRDLHEAGFTAAMRDVHAVGAAVSARRGSGGRDEERIGALDDGERRTVETRIDAFDRMRGAEGSRVAAPCRPARLDVLRAVAEALIDCQREAADVEDGHRPVHAVPPPGRELDPEETERLIDGERVGERITARRQGVDAQRMFVFGVHEPGRADEDRRPRTAGRVHAADEHHGKMREELLVLERHRVSDDGPADARHRLADAGPLLDGDLAGVERRRAVVGVVVGHTRCSSAVPCMRESPPIDTSPLRWVE